MNLFARRKSTPLLFVFWMNMLNRKFISIILYSHTDCYFENINLKVDHQTGGKWFIPGSKHGKGHELLSLEPAWLSLV